MRNPVFLYFAIIPVILTLYYITQSGKAFEQFYTYSHLKDKGSKKYAFIFRRNLVAFMLCIASVFMLIPLADPSEFIKSDIPSDNTNTQFQDFSLVIDISNSMTADDGGESRLEKVQKSIISFIFSNSGRCRYSITVFKGSSTVILPLSSDKNLIVSVIEKLSPDIFTSKGTAFADALEAASTVFPEHEKSERKMIIFTDGEESSSGEFEKDISRISGIISDKMISFLIVMPDNSEGSPVSAGEDSHMSIPDFNLMKKAADQSGGSVVKISSFTSFNFKNTASGPDISVYFLICACVFLFTAFVIRRTGL